MKTLRILTILALFSVTAFADGKLELKPDDSIASVLKQQIGQRVELRMRSGEKLGGKVVTVGEKAAHISAITGQEFYDAVVVLNDISAVLVRTGGK